MGFETSDFDTRLGEFDEDDFFHDVRMRLLEELSNIVDFDACLHVSLIRHDEQLYYTRTDGVGDTELVQMHRSYDGEPVICDGLWDPRHPKSGTINCFTKTNFSKSYLEESDDELLSELDDHGIRALVRMPVYEDGELISVILGLRRSASGFGAHEMRKLRDHEDDVVSTLVSFDQTHNRTFARVPGHLLFTQDSRAALTAKSADADEWLYQRRREILERWLEAIDSDSVEHGQPPPVLRAEAPGRLWVGLLDTYVVRIAPLIGEDANQLLASLRAAERPSLGPLADLTDRQREVARLAASGHTNREIAESLNITPDTVGDHLSAIYERLELANRVELANHISK